MSTLQPSEVWILILISSILVISNVVSSDNDLQTLQRIPETCSWIKDIRNNPTQPQDQQNEQNVFSELMCISSDQNIYNIVEETKNQCKGNDYIVTFYYKKDKSYTNLGSFATDKYLFQNILKKYNNWLLTDSIVDLKDKKIINGNPKGDAKQYANYNDLSASPIFAEESFTKSPELDVQMGNYPSINSSDYSNYNFIFSNEGPEVSSANCEILDDVDTRDGRNGYLKSRYNSQLKGYEVFVPEEAQEGSSTIINVTLDSEVKNDDNIIEVDQIEDLKDINNGGYFKTEVIDVLLNKDYDEFDFVPNTYVSYNLGKEANTEHSMPYMIIDDTLFQNANNHIFDNNVDKRNFSPDSNNIDSFNIDLDNSEISPDSTYIDDSLNSLEMSTSSRDFATYAKPALKQFYDTKGSNENLFEVAQYKQRTMPLLPLKSNPQTIAQTLVLDQQVSYPELSVSQKPCSALSSPTAQFNIPLSTFSNPNIDSFTVQLPQFNSNSERQSFITAQYLPSPDIIPNLDVTIKTRDTPNNANYIKFLPLYAQALYGKSPTSFYTKPILNILPGISQASFKNPFLIYPLLGHTARSTNFYDSINNEPQSHAHTYNAIDTNVSPYYTVDSLPFNTISPIPKTVSESNIPLSLPLPAALETQLRFQSEQTDSLPHITSSKSGPCAVSDMSPLYFSSFTNFPYDSSSYGLPTVENSITKTSKMEFHESNEQFLSIPQIPTSPISKTGSTEILSPLLRTCSNSIYRLVDSDLGSPKGEHFNIQTLPYMNLPNIASLPCSHKTTWIGQTDLSNSFSPYIYNFADTLPKATSICHVGPVSQTALQSFPFLKNPYMNLVSPISFLDPSSSFTSPLLNKEHFLTHQYNASPSKASDLSISPIITPIDALTDPTHITYYNPIAPQTTGKANLLSILPSVLPKLNPFCSETTNVLPETYETSIDLPTKPQPMKFIGLLPDPATFERSPYTLYSPSSINFSTQYSPSVNLDKDKIQHIYTPQIVSSKEMQSILEQIKLLSTPIQTAGASFDTTPNAAPKRYMSAPQMEYVSTVSNKMPFSPLTSFALSPERSLRSSMISDSPKFINPIEYIKPLPHLSTTLTGPSPSKLSSLLPAELSDISWTPNMLPINSLIQNLNSKNSMQYFPTPIISPLQPPEKVKVSLSPYLPPISPLIDSKSDQVVQYLSKPLISPLQPSEKLSTVLIPPISELKPFVDLTTKEISQYLPKPVVSPLQFPKFVSKTLIQSNIPENPLIDLNSKQIVEFLSKPLISPLQPSEKIKLLPILPLSPLIPLIDSKSKNILQYLSAPIVSPLQPSEKFGLTLTSPISPRTLSIDSVPSTNPFKTLTPKETVQYYSTPIISSLQPSEKIRLSLASSTSPRFPLIDSTSKDILQYLPKPIVSPLQPPEKVRSLLSLSVSPLIDSKSKEIEQNLPAPLISSLQPPERIRVSPPLSSSPTFSLTDSMSKEVLQYLPKPIVSPLQPPEKVRSLLSLSVSPLIDSKSKEIEQYLPTTLISSLQPPEKIKLSLPSATSSTFPLTDSTSKQILQYLPKPIVSPLQPPEKIKSLFSPCISPLVDLKSKEIVPFLSKPLISSLQSPEKIRLSLQSFPLIDSTSNQVLHYLPKPIMSPLQPPEKVKSLISSPVSPLINSKSKKIEQYLPTPLISSLQPPEKVSLLLPSPISPTFPLIDSTSKEILQYLSKPIFSPLQAPEKIAPLVPPSSSPLVNSKLTEQYLPKPIVSPLQPHEKIKPLISPSMSPLIDSKSKEIMQYLTTPLISSLQPPEKISLPLSSLTSPKFPLIELNSKEVLQYLPKPIVSPLQPPEKIKSLISPSMSPLIDSKSKEIIQYLPTPLISSLQPPEKIRLSLPLSASTTFPLTDSTSNEILQYLSKPIVSPLQPPEKFKPLLSPSMSPSRIQLIDSKSKEIVQYLPMPLISSLQTPEIIPEIPSMPFTSPLLVEKLQKDTPYTSKLIVSPLQPPEILNLRPVSVTKSVNKQSYPTYTGHTFYSNLKPSSIPISQPIFTSIYSNLPMTHLNIVSSNIGSCKPKNSDWTSVYSNLPSKLEPPLLNIRKPQPSDSFLYITPLSLPGIEKNVLYSLETPKPYRKPLLLKKSFPTPQYTTYYSNLPLKEALKSPSSISDVSTDRNTNTYLPAESSSPSFTPLFTPPHSSTTDYLRITQYYSPFSVKYSNMPTNKLTLSPTSMSLTSVPLFEHTFSNKHHPLKLNPLKPISPKKLQFTDVLFSNLPITKPLNTQASTTKYMESFSNIKNKKPLKFQNIIEYIDKIGTSVASAPEMPITYHEYAKLCKHSYKSAPSPYIVAYSNIQKHNSQTSSTATNSFYEYLPSSNSYINPTSDLKTSVYNYVRHEEMKPNLFNAINEVNVPLGNFIIAKRDCVNTTTENINSAIDLRIWPSDKMKLVEARLVLKLIEIQGRNFAPVVKNMGQYNAKQIENIATNYIQNKYGNVIQVRNANKQYEVIRVNNINNNYNLLWPANTCTTPC